MINIQKTHEELVKDEVVKIVNYSDNISKGTDNRHKSLWNMIWHNSIATPQEIFDLFGQNAVKLFQLSSALQHLLTEVLNGYEMMSPPYEYTINEDGTVTVGNKIEQEPLEEENEQNQTYN